MKGKVYGGKDLLKSQVLSSEWNTERVKEDASDNSEDGEDDELSCVIGESAWDWLTLSFVKTKAWNHGLKPKFYPNSEKPVLAQVRIKPGFKPKFTRCSAIAETPRTDRQTDRRRDRILIARPRLHSMQRGKNRSLKPKIKWFGFKPRFLPRCR